MNAAGESKPVSFRSKFGGFWTDLSNADEIVDGKLELGSISSEEAAQLRFWIANGFLIIKDAVGHELIDEALKDIARVYEAKQALIETYEYGDVRQVRVEPRHRRMRHKLLDAYAHSETLQKLILSEKIVRFLTVVFDRPPLAFQGLYFETGSRQDIHQDTAYVRVNHPMELAASWIAMEDIKQGSGELEYYVGSHRIPEYLFEGKDKWMPYGSTEHARFLSHLKEESERIGLKREQFRPMKGDALIWHADLCHGGSPVTKETTRRSFVTHYCPSTSAPFYFSNNHSGKIRCGTNAYFAYSYHGHLDSPYL